jgi:hypothetical protein
MNCTVPVCHDPRDPVTLVALVGQFAAIMACRNCVGSAWLVHLASKALMVAMRESPAGMITARVDPQIVVNCRVAMAHWAEHVIVRPPQIVSMC